MVECDPACEEGFECVDGECVEVVVECDPACEEGFECVDGECVEVEPADEFEILITYLEGDNGNYINDAAPKVVNASDVMAEGLEEWHIIDIRGKDKYGPDGDGVWKKEPNGKPDYEDGHIAGATFVALADMKTYAETNLTADDKILVACHTGQGAGHAVLVLNLLGYDAYSLKWGMSSWHADFDIWSGKLSSDYAGQFVQDADTGKNEPGDYPTLTTGEATGEAILAARIDELLAGDPKFMVIPDLVSAPEDFYVVNYWPEEEYLAPGHFEGAHQYTPKSSLHTTADLATLPTDQTIAVYCYSGQHGSQVAAFLTLLGYDARDVKFGTNGMIFDQMIKKQWPGAEDGPQGYDYVTD